MSRLLPVVAAACLLVAPPAWSGTRPASEDGWLVDQWTSADGLPTDHAMDVARTPDGLLWIATTSGLIRFDGTRFEALGPEELPGLRTSRQVALAVHPDDGALWILSDLGQAVSRLKGGQLTVWDRQHGFTPPPVSLSEDAEGLWLATDEGLFSLSDHPEPALAELIHGRVEGTVLAPDGARWVAGEGEIIRLEPSGRVTRLGADLGVPSHYGRILLGPEGAPLLSPDPGQETLLWDGARFSPVQGPVRTAAWTAQLEAPSHIGGPDSAWALSTAGVHHAGTLVFPFEGRVSSALIDGDALWLTTFSAGLLRIRPASLLVVRSGQADEQVSAVMVDARDRLWLRGMDDWWTPGPDGPGLLADASKVEGGYLFEGEEGLVLAGPGLSAIAEDAAGARRRVTLSDLALEYPMSHLVDATGRTWIGDRGGLFVSDGGRWVEQRTREGSTIPDVRAILPHPDGGLLLAAGGRGLLWLSPDGGLQRLDEHSGALTDNIRHLRLEEGWLWASTEDNGLCAVPMARAASQPWRCVGPAQGLPARGAHASVRDSQGRVWVSTNSGIAVTRAEELMAFAEGLSQQVVLLVLDERDGMPSAETNGGNDQAFAWDRAGRLWFPTQRGAVGLDPSTFALPDAPPVRLVGALVGEQWVADGPVALEPRQTALRVRWTVPESPLASRLQFRTRTGDQPWSRPSGAREATFAALPPGASRIEVQAGLAGAWGPAATLRVRRSPLLRERAVFPALLLGIGGLGVAGVAWALGRARRAREAQLEAEVRTRTAELAASAALLAAQRDQLEDQAGHLAQLNDLRTRMIVNLHHELRTPIALILGPIQSLLGRGALTPEAQRDGELAQRGARQLARLTDQLFDIARLEAGELPIRARWVDLAALARRVTGRLAYAAERRGITLTDPAQGLSLWCDPDLIDKALGNLVHNALKFAPEGSTVRVTVTQEGGRARVSVLDEGPGVPPADRARVFERLFQVDRDDRRAQGGAGLGLALAREVVELHDGRIGVEARQGGGSAFWFTLPTDGAPQSIDEVALDQDQDDLCPDSPDQPLDRGEGPLVLVVEDHPDMRAFLAAQLAPLGRVATAGDGAEGLRRAQAEAPDLIVADVMMPGMTGLELARALRAAPDSSAVPILLVSAKAAEEDRVAGLAVADDYLVKPFGVAELRARARRLLRRAGSAGVTPRPIGSEPVTDADSALLARLERIADEHLPNEAFGVLELAERAAMSERTLRRELHRLAGESPSDWLRGRRLLRAQALLSARAFRTASEVAAAVGLSRSYFGRAYRAWAGCSPGDALRRPP